ncbi:mycothiol system anti-sigma-R factor [Corynebacterium sp. LK2510]|uniref:mycothiol system anti-sigma-R factor n=1 Tax=Corynebacterium sp. LK2510 TaxID=3110472 RepID=UPI0034CE3F0B
MASAQGTPGSCEEARQLLRELLDDNPTPERATTITQKLSACPQCDAMLKAELEIRGLVRRCCGEAHAPEPLRERIMTSITTVTVTQFHIER